MPLNVLPAPVDEATLKARLIHLDKFEAQLTRSIQWQECESAAAYRKMRREGLNGFTAPALNPKAKTVDVLGRDGHQIELRIIAPQEKPSRGVWLHFHAVVSVEYRLAPENSFPKPLHDCVDAALYALSPAGEKDVGAPLKIVGGESAGGWLAVSTGLSLRRDYGVHVRSRLDGIVAGYGIFDLTYTPSLLEHTRNIVLSKEGMMDFCEASFSHIPMEKRKDPLVSPLYADLKEMPPALFLSGDIEPLLDDSVFMAARWQQAGNLTELSVVPGACHAFTIIPMGGATDEGLNIIVKFVQQNYS
ncbi:uncharacterized protein N7479_009718 [Penicillium vulpinum]|uniref:uncharacterized protein n=1 Tax=Penicillium vulpinum TaxID=29845 RepID=UPI002548118C|nr:uncharacterized protein N7479_009718 [Penicillium vulpinum]KAJ5951305.1 hypothetical protein N7479_009718 [Penicillium vulpinum]